MKPGSKVAITCCSNGLGPEQTSTIDMLTQILEKTGFVPVLSPFLYGDKNGYAGTARQRADTLMNFYKDESIEEIFDVSGGDMQMRSCPISTFRKLHTAESISGDTATSLPF